MSDSKIAIIINMKSGMFTKEERAAFIGNIDAYFKERKASYKLYKAYSRNEPVRFARAAIDEGFDVVAAAGGDGTINAVASEVYGSAAALGIIPLGTFNHLAKDLRLPVELEQSLKILADGVRKNIDIGLVNNKIFLNNSSIGIYPELVLERETYQRDGMQKFFAAFRASLGVLRRFSFVNVRLKIDGQGLVRQTPFVIIGNNEYSLDGLQMGSRTSLTKGDLSLYLLHRSGRMGLLKLLLLSLFGRAKEHESFDVISAKEVLIYSKRKKLNVALDGEVVKLATPLTYVIVPRGISIMVQAE